VRVGRAPIDEEAIRLLEQHNPDVQFDWTRILKSPADEGQGFGRRGGRDGGRREDRRDPRDARPQPRPSTAANHATDRAEPIATDDTKPTELATDDTESMATDHAEYAERATEPTEPVTVHQELPEPSEPIDTVEPRYARIGSDGLGRLRARYAEVMARIAERPMDEAVREELKLKAERLNPDGWVTTDEVSQALEQYEVVFEELRAVVGRHPRRRSRR
jgi:hypothetical protein